MENVKKYGWLAGHFLLSLSILLLLVWAFNRGLDFTDEADSLLATMQPFDMTLRFSEYMFYTNWLYLLAGESLFGFRVYGLIILLVPSVYLAWQGVLYLQEWYPQEKSTTLCFFLCLFTASTAYYCKWYPSPNYYWLAQVGLTVVAASLLHIVRLQAQGRFSAPLFFLMGVGLTITGFGRVTAAMLAIVLVCTVVLIVFAGERKNALTGLALTGLTGFVLLLAHMAFVAGGIETVIAIYLQKFAPELASERSSLTTQLGYIAGAFTFIARKAERNAIFVFGIPFLAYGYWKYGLWKTGKIAMYPVWLMGIVVLDYYRYFFRDYGDPSEIAAAMFSLILLSSLFFISIMPLAKHEKIKIACICVLLFLFAMAMGLWSAMPLLWGMSRSLIFIVAAVLLCIWIATAHVTQQGVAQGLSFLVMLAVAGIMVSAVGFRTYRQPPLWQHSENVTLHGKNTINLWPEAADFVQTLQTEAAAHGWEKGIPVLDFGANNAGIAYILGAATPGNGRIYGGYDNTNAFARLVTQCLSPEQKRQAWIVTSTDAKSRVSPAVIQELFPNFPQNYVKVWEHKNPSLKGLGEKQMLWKPINKSISSFNPLLHN